MRKLINIWKIPWDSHWMQRAIHILSVLRKRPALHVIPKGREQGWHRDSGHAHQSSQLWEVQLRSQFAFSQLHLFFLFACCFGQPRPERRDGQALLCWYKWSTPRALLGIVLLETVEKRGRTLCSPLRTTPHREGVWKCSRAGQPLRGTQRSLVKLLKDKCKVLSLPRAATAALEAQLWVSDEHSCSRYSSSCTNSILTAAQTWWEGDCRDEDGFYQTYLILAEGMQRPTKAGHIFPHTQLLLHTLIIAQAGLSKWKIPQN